MFKQAGPILAGLAVAIGVPILLVGTYIIIPISMVKEHKRNKKLKNHRDKILQQQQQQEMEQGQSMLPEEIVQIVRKKIFI